MVVEFAGVGGGVVEVFVEDVLNSTAKRNGACSDLVEDDADGVDIGAVIDVFAVLDLFGRGVFEGAKDRACGGFVFDIVEEFGDSKVADLGLHLVAVAGEQDVSGFEIAVNNARIVGIRKAVEQRPEKAPHLGEGQQFFSLDQILFEIRPVDPLLKHTEHLVFVEDLCDLDDVGVFQAKLDLGFADKARAHDLIVREVRKQQFERKRLIQKSVANAEDPSHAAFGDLFFHDIAVHQGPTDQIFGVL